MFKGRKDITNLNKIEEQRRFDIIIQFIAIGASVIFLYIDMILLALVGFFIAITIDNRIIYWDIKHQIIKYSKKGGVIDE